MHLDAEDLKELEGQLVRRGKNGGKDGKEPERDKSQNLFPLLFRIAQTLEALAAKTGVKSPDFERMADRIAESLDNIEIKPVINVAAVESVAPKVEIKPTIQIPARAWRFEIERDREGRMKVVEATPK